MQNYKNNFLKLSSLSLLLLSMVSMNASALAETSAAPSVNTTDNGAAPFPVSSSAKENAQKEVFSYALESGFVRISITNIANNETKGPTKNKDIYGLISMDLKNNWKTYWSNPGSSGFAPSITLDGGAKAEILYPKPILFPDPVDWTYGYKGKIRLPFHVTLPKDQKQSQYTGSLMIGICETLCVPQKLPFQVSTGLPHNPKISTEIQKALDSLPKKASNGFEMTSAKAVKDNIIELSLRYPQSQGIKAPEVFLNGGETQIGLAKAKGVPSLSKTNPHDSENNQKEDSKAFEQKYQAKLLFGEAEIGQIINYTAVLRNGEAVEGKVEITKSDKTTQ